MSDSDGGIEFLTFHIDKTMSGMDILDIQEVTNVAEITRTPRAPEYVEGIINLRGNVVTIVNLGKKLGLRPVEKKAENQVIIVCSDEEYIGLMVDDVDTVVSVKGAQIEPSPANLQGVQGNFFKGVLKRENQLIGILKTAEILSVPDHSPDPAAAPPD